MTGCAALLCLRLPCSSTYAPAARQRLRTRTSFDRRAILEPGAKRQSCLERQCGKVPPRRQGSAHTCGVSMGTRQADTITVHAHMWSDELARRLGATLLLVCLARLGYFIPIPGRVSGQRAPGCQKLQCLQQVLCLALKCIYHVWVAGVCVHVGTCATTAVERLFGSSAVVANVFVMG